MNTWNENLLFFKNNAPIIYNKMTAEEDDEKDIEVFFQEDSNIVRVKKASMDIFLESTFNLKRQAERYFFNCDENAGLIVVLGIANLNLFKEIKKHFKFLKRLIIIEPSIKIFNTMMKVISIKKIFSSFPDSDISIILNENFDKVNMHYKSYMFSYPTETATVITPVGYSSLFPLHKNKIDAFNADAAFQNDASRNTRKFFRYMWHVNEWRNLSVNAPSLKIITDLISKMPVIIVSAGPSLNKNIHLLKEVGDRALIIAAGSAIRILHKHNIIPHLRISVEGTSMQQRLFEGIDTKEAPLLYVNNINYETLRSYKDNSIEFFLHKGYKIKKFIFDKLNIYAPEISSGSSVSNMAVFLAASFGSKKIIIMGQDLCGQQDKHYAEGSWTSEKENASLFAYTNKYPAFNMYGERVYTTSSFLNIKKTLELAASVYKNSHYINATEGGLVIDGYENKRFINVINEDLLEEPILEIRQFLREKIDEYNESKKLLNKEVLDTFVNWYKNEIENVQKEIEKLAKYTAQGVEDKKLRRLKKQVEKICDNQFYAYFLSEYFGLEIMAIKYALISNDLEERSKALTNFTDEVLHFISFTYDLIDEFLGKKEQLNIIFQA